MTSRELLALCIGLVLLALGWAMDPRGGRGGAGGPVGAGGADGAVGAVGAVGAAPDGQAAAPNAGHARGAPRAAEADGAGAARVAAAPESTRGAGAASEPSLEPIAWPAGGLHVRVTTADGALAVGAPLGVWVVGGRTPLVLADSDDEGRVRFVGVLPLAARYEVGLAAPLAPRIGWPPEDRAAPSDDVRARASEGLAREAPLELTLPPCGTLAVHVVRASRPGTRVELGQGTAASFQVARTEATGADGVARFAWLPLGLELTLRVPFDAGALEVLVAGPDAPPDLGAARAPAEPAARRVTVAPEGLVEG